jgi:hypothetical protein
MSCPQILSGYLPAPLPLALGAPQTQTLSDTSLEAGLVSYLHSKAGITCLVGSRIYAGYAQRGQTSFPLLVYEVTTVDLAHVLSGSAGYATAEIELDCFSSAYADVVQLAEVLRQCLDGFRGWWGCVGIASCLVTGWHDDDEAPQDGSGTWWYRRGLELEVTFYQPVPQF